MTSDGRLTIPKLTMEILKQREEKNLEGCILEVAISPTGRLKGAVASDNAETKMLGKIKSIRRNLGNATS